MSNKYSNWHIVNCSLEKRIQILENCLRNIIEHKDRYVILSKYVCILVIYYLNK